MSILRGDASEIYALANELTQVGAKAVAPLRSSMLQVGEATAVLWRGIATATAGEHGKHYPKSITAELAFGVSTISVDVGPDSSMPQGGMGPGFEFGSVNQPPHLDGVKALEATGPRAEKVIDATVGHLFP